MKNLYYVFLLIFFFNKGYSQNDLQNANWIFGENVWFNFINVPPQQINLAPFTRYSIEGIASVSDIRGNLLFWTDGEKVYGLDAITNNPFIYTNGDGLFGNSSSFQNVVIVPRPKNPGIFYIVSISGYTGDFPYRRGLYYSEVNTITNEVNSLIKNIPLRDNDGLNIDDSYGNISESITTAPSDDGNYWVLTHIQNNTNSFIYSYRVTEDGIISSNGTAQMPFHEFELTNNINNPSLGLKISPDLNVIGLTRVGNNPIVGSFNNGVVIFDLNPIGNINLNSNTSGLEFDNDSNNLFFSRNNEVVGVELNNPNVEIILDGIQPNPSAIQRSIDGRLYIARKGFDYVSVIENPLNINDLSYNPEFQVIDRTCYAGLPQWVWFNCETDVTLFSPNHDANNLSPFSIRYIEKSEWINATNKIGVGDNTIQEGVVYHAGNFVELNVGFEGVFGSKFSGYIEGCSNNFQYRQASSSSSANFSNKKKSNLLLYPNPTNDKVEIKLNNQMFEKVSITTIDGKMMFESDIEKTDKFILDVSRFAQGIYIINVVSENEEIQSQKLIKK
ncbi:T9SS type A sorting domain-containing protein [Flavobacterium sp.]|uniref:T9SS type A sorting domain-containing protein n=1 Tax=Flavobacterium sp. TaxID=239 RepID=UPI0022CA0BA5|nr:T9SS type A sorting domain-containing protein [Flavobacterium sp.]MCZ8090583.1 T9SS type A sorting domain-containing protein [Flavobacterium sp.]